MFRPILADVTVTCLILFGLTIAANVTLPRRGYRRGNVLAGSVALSIVLFVPAVIAVSLMTDLIRYGEFRYDSAAEIGDGHVELPESATGIIVVRYYAGHSAQFSVTGDALQAWLSKIGAKPARLDQWWPFDKYGWSAADDLQHVCGPRAATGAGFDVWYSPSQSVAWQRADYW